MVENVAQLLWSFCLLLHDTEGLNEITINNLMKVGIIFICILKGPYKVQNTVELFVQ